ncbi:hypothetical protein K3495_g1744 [Podosphaera aphanis]|nr:hypothetical protein K3495_g1744 [Podosphaera aphanis]
MKFENFADEVEATDEELWLGFEIGRKSFYSKRTSQSTLTKIPLQYPLTATPVESRYQNFTEKLLFESARNAKGFHQTIRVQQ